MVKTDIKSHYISLHCYVVNVSAFKHLSKVILMTLLGDYTYLQMDV